MKNSKNKRLYLLAVILFLGFGCVWLMPNSGDIRSSRLSRYLPMEFLGEEGTKVLVTGKELQILAKDTEFERVSYRNPLEVNRHPIEVSVVFSGKDLNNSIHRPERCLRSQGWNFIQEKQIELKNVLPGGKSLPLKQIVCSRPFQLNSGKVAKIVRVQYYTFFGHEVITSGHYERTLQDMKDRVVGGFDQQWAYATFSMPVTQSYADSGLSLGGLEPMNLEESETALLEFIKKLVPKVLD